ncbi:MAG: DHA2 family efflux MFS transporter permease subunit [Beijerinckiaceae bacterium]|nr:DHA2 family efflux MFS transporter permease subunit [Beijerinckiaceae bacterium]MCI0736354.1 DHA2 family efflux MFS transporter permease subunit [Beijerinckiaceae bacterium]
MPAYLITALTVACALFMENLDSTVISTSLPAIASDLREDPISLKLALTSYLLSLAIFIPASGWAADRFGARTIFRAAILVFTGGSILCGMAASLPELVGARMVQGLGGAMMVPVGRLLLLRSVERSELVNALSYLTVPALLGPVAGPLIGGFITTYVHWRWIFWINVPIGAAGLILATLYVEDIKSKAHWPFDVTGFFLCGLGLAFLLFGLGGARRGLLASEAAILLAGLGALSLILFAWHARGAAFPLLDLKLLSIRTFRASVLGGSLFRIGIGSIPFLLPLMLQMSFGMNALQSGSITFIAAAGAMAMKVTAAPILRVFGFRKVLIYNAMLSAAFLGSYGFFTPSTPVALMMGLLLIGGFVRSLEFTSLNAIAYAETGASQMSRAVSFASVAQQLSLSLGVAAGAGALQGFALFNPGTDVLALENFKWAFATMAAVSLSAAFAFLRLPADAGEELTQVPAGKSPGVISPAGQ